MCSSDLARAVEALRAMEAMSSLEEAFKLESGSYLAVPQGSNEWQRLGLGNPDSRLWKYEIRINEEGATPQFFVSAERTIADGGARSFIFLFVHPGIPNGRSWLGTHIGTPNDDN